MFHCNFITWAPMGFMTDVEIALTDTVGKREISMELICKYDAVKLFMDTTSGDKRKMVHTYFPRKIVMSLFNNHTIVVPATLVVMPSDDEKSQRIIDQIIQYKSYRFKDILCCMPKQVGRWTFGRLLQSTNMDDNISSVIEYIVYCKKFDNYELYIDNTLHMLKVIKYGSRRLHMQRVCIAIYDTGEQRLIDHYNSLFSV